MIAGVQDRHQVPHLQIKVYSRGGIRSLSTEMEVVQRPHQSLHFSTTINRTFRTVEMVAIVDLDRLTFTQCLKKSMPGSQ